MREICGHTFDDELLPEAPVVLDVGARDFHFTRGILALRPAARIIAVEPDPAVLDPQIPGVELVRAALVGDARTESGYASFSTGEGNHLAAERPSYARSFHVVPCVSLPRVMKEYSTSFFDLVKLDCEGAEFGVLAAWPGPVARQISVEFHDHTDLAKYDDAFYAKLFAGLPWYEAKRHGLIPVGPGRSLGHWDSHLVLRDDVTASDK